VSRLQIVKIVFTFATALCKLYLRKKAIKRANNKVYILTVQQVQSMNNEHYIWWYLYVF